MIDTHSHIFSEEFKDDLPEVIARAKEIGVEKIFMPNIDDTSVEAMLNVCQAYPGYCFPMLGFHPTSVEGPDALYKVKEMKKRLVEGHPYIAIGEVGVDLYWDTTWLKEQQQILDVQIQWALEWIDRWQLDNKAGVPLIFSVVFGKVTPEELVQWLLESQRSNLRFQLQMHKFIWPPEMRGV